MRDKSCKKCIHFGCCMDWQHIQDENLQQRTTTEEDFIQCVNCEDCQFYLDAEIITRQQAEIEALIAGQETLQKYIAQQQARIDEFMKETAVTTLIDDAVIYTPTLEDYNKFKKEIKSEAVKDVLDKVRTARNQSLINKTSAYKIEKILEKMVCEKNEV